MNLLRKQDFRQQADSRCFLNCADVSQERMAKLIMDTSVLIEIFGYLGSALVVVSMLMASVVKLRVINTAGSTISGIYALIIGSFPLALMNFCLIVINVYNLYKLLKTEQQYDLISGIADDDFLNYFLEHYDKDIQIYFPGFEKKKSFDQAYIVCCNGNPAGVLLGRQNGDGVLDIAIDYSTPMYRDCSIGTYLYSKLPEKGIHTLCFAQEESQPHISYMRKMGFVKEKDAYVKKL